MSYNDASRPPVALLFHPAIDASYPTWFHLTGTHAGCAHACGNDLFAIPLFQRGGCLPFLSHRSDLVSLHRGQSACRRAGTPVTLPRRPCALLADRLTRHENSSFREKPITQLARSSRLQGLVLIGRHTRRQTTAVLTLLLLSA